MKLRFVSFICFLSLSFPTYASDLDIAAQLLENYCTEYFGMINVEFENTTAEWMEIQNVRVSFGSGDMDKKISVVTGERLTSWNDAIQIKLKTDAFYSRLLLGTIAAIGASSSEKSSSIGGVFALGAATALTISEISSAKTQISLGDTVPRTHLLSGKIQIPPGLSISRWALFNTNPSDNIPIVTHITITAQLKDGSVRTEKISLRWDNNDACRWQSKQMKKT